MNIKDNPAIYLMPGMAASPKIFERLQFPSNCRVHLLDWITPEKNESLAHYAGRIAEEITELPYSWEYRLEGLSYKKLLNNATTTRN